jgi:predicted transcriptional regulator
VAIDTFSGRLRRTGRNYKSVHTDATGLVELGLMDRDEDGALSTPYDEIVIHAGIRDAA